MAGRRNSYSKRSRSDYFENGGQSKRRNPGEERESYVPRSEDTVYRYLCPVRKIGSVIGRGGEIIKQLRQESQSKIRIGETMHGCEERVITLFSSSEETKRVQGSDKYVCPAQDALLRIFERIISDDRTSDDDTKADGEVTVRLLLPSDQSGSVIGKGGQIIQSIRNETGAQIRILKNESLPPCSLNGDELLQIIGEPSAVKKALSRAASRLHDNPSRFHDLIASAMSNTYQPEGQFLGANGSGSVMGVPSIVGPYGGYNADAVGEWPSHPYVTSRRDGSEREFSLRLVCPTSNIGGVIGRGGEFINQIRQQSGASIKVDSSSAKGDDCLITISATEYFEDTISPTINAAVRLQLRCSDKVGRDSDDILYTTRLIVPMSRIGCLIGKGGNIIYELRKATRANIRIFSKENLPKVASEDDEMVQISGDSDTVRDALVQVATRLRANIFDKEDALLLYPSAIPYSTDISDNYYGGRDTRSYQDAYVSYPQNVAAVSYESYTGYPGRHGPGLASREPVSRFRHQGY